MHLRCHPEQSEGSMHVYLPRQSLRARKAKAKDWNAQPAVPRAQPAIL